MIGVGISIPQVSVRARALAAAVSLIALGAAAGELAHSYGQNGVSFGTLITSNPLIATTPQNFMQLLVSRCPGLRYDVWHGWHYVTLAKTGAFGSVIVGEPVSQAGTGASGTVLAKGPNKVTILNTGGINFNTTTVNFATSGVSANPITTTTNVNNKGYTAAISGDTIQAADGNMGCDARIPYLQGLPRAAKVLYINPFVNSAIGSNLSAAQCLLDAKQLYDDARLAFPDALILFADCNIFRNDQGSNDYTFRQRIADINTGFWTQVVNWPDYNTKLMPLAQAQAMQLGSTGNITTDMGSFATGTGGALCTVTNTNELHINAGATGVNPQVGDVVCGPLATTLTAGTTITGVVTPGSVYTLSNSAAIGSNTQFYWGMRFADPAKMADSLHIAQGGLYVMVEAANAWLADKITIGDWWWATYGLTATNCVTAPTSTFSGAGGGKSSTATVAWVPTGSVPTGLTVATSGPGSATVPSSVACSIVAGTGDVRIADGSLAPGNNGASVGANLLRLTYVNNGVLGDVIKVTANTLTTGIFANAAAGWAQCYGRVRHDSSGVLQNVMLSMLTSSSQKSQCLLPNSITGALAIGLPPQDMLRVLTTPPFYWDGVSNNPAALGKWVLQIDGPGTGATPRPGTAVIDILPFCFACQVSDPTV